MTTDLQRKLQPKNGETIAFNVAHGAWRALAFYREGPDARIILARDGETIREFEYPSYRIWNIAAHLPDIAAEHESRDAESSP